MPLQRRKFAISAYSLARIDLMKLIKIRFRPIVGLLISHFDFAQMHELRCSDYELPHFWVPNPTSALIFCIVCRTNTGYF